MTEADVQKLDYKLDIIKGDIVEIKERLNTNYVSMDRYKPVEKLVYGVVGLLVLGVVGGLLTLVLRASK